MIKIYLKDDILNEMNDKFTPSDDEASLFMALKFPDSTIKESINDCYKQKSLYGIQTKVFSSIKPLISILEFSKYDWTKTEIT